MQSHVTSGSLVILKFGGSVLRESSDIPSVAREIGRYLSAFERVIAVVSAFKHQTDTLERAARALCPHPSEDALAFYIGLGEMRSAGELTLGLQAAGVSATLRMPWDVWLLSSGSPLEAAPVAVSQQRFLDAFHDHRVVVFPGFIGRGREGTPHVLGRGGSDLTAIFLAAELGAERCVLLKDTPGLYEWDPSPDGPRPRRYATMTWEDAIALGSGSLKPAHVEYARSRSVVVEVTAPGAAGATIVGAGASELVAHDSFERTEREPFA
jgi:homoserine dehydrogenase